MRTNWWRPVRARDAADPDVVDSGRAATQTLQCS